MTGNAASPRRPAGLGKHGGALWRHLHASYVFEPWELSVIELACRQADDLALLEAAIREDGILVEGSKGQARLAQVVTEARQARQAVARLLVSINLPGDSAAGVGPQSQASRRGQAAAQKRWRNHEKLSRGKGGSANGATA